MDNKLSNIKHTNPNITALTSICNITLQRAVPHCACNTDGTKTDGRRREELVNITGNSKKGKGTVIPLQAMCGSDFQ
jgi:hypothetical protein